MTPHYVRLHAAIAAHCATKGFVPGHPLIDDATTPRRACWRYVVAATAVAAGVFIFGGEAYCLPL